MVQPMNGRGKNAKNERKGKGTFVPSQRSELGTLGTQLNADGSACIISYRHNNFRECSHGWSVCFLVPATNFFHWQNRFEVRGAALFSSSTHCTLLRACLHRALCWLLARFAVAPKAGCVQASASVVRDAGQQLEDHVEMYWNISYVELHVPKYRVTVWNSYTVKQYNGYFLSSSTVVYVRAKPHADKEARRTVAVAAADAQWQRLRIFFRLLGRALLAATACRAVVSILRTATR